MTLPFTRAAWRPLCSAAVLAPRCGPPAPALPNDASTCRRSRWPLSRLAQQAQVQVLFDESLLRGLRAPALSGSYGVREALERLLVGSELELVEAGGGYVVRRRRSTPTATTRCNWTRRPSSATVAKWTPATSAVRP